MKKRREDPKSKIEMGGLKIGNPKSKIITVLIVDDSSFMRKSLTHILASDPSIEVVGTAADGKDAIEKVKKLRPRVVLLDIEMPVMDGIAALAHIMAECPVPVLMLSAHNKRDAAIAVKSLNHGAVDFIPKPSGVISYDIDKLGQEIITKVKMAANVNVKKMDRFLPEVLHWRQRQDVRTRKKMVVVGASTGGPQALTMVLSHLPRDISAAIMVVQHMSREFIPSFVESLQWRCSLSISVARQGMVINPGHALIAPGGYHTLVIQSNGTKKIRLSRRAAFGDVFPSIDHAMRSAAGVYGGDTLGVLLTGLGNDGAKGMKAIKDAGGNTIVEDPSTCIVFGMPKAAMELGCVDETIPLPRIAERILEKI